MVFTGECCAFSLVFFVLQFLVLLLLLLLLLNLCYGSSFPRNDITTISLYDRQLDNFNWGPGDVDVITLLLLISILKF